MATSITKSIIYARKSSEYDDRQVLSIDSQIDELVRYAAKARLQVAGIFREAQSAKEPGRPVFEELLRFIQRNRIDSFLCWKLDRLARNPIDGAKIIWALEKHTLQEVRTPSQSFCNTGNDKFWMQLEFGMAKKYVDDLSENTKRGIRAKLRLGWRPGKPPVGYLNDKQSKTIKRDSSTYHLIRRLWELMLTGQYPAAAVLPRVQLEYGYAPGNVSPSNIYKIFRNPFYKGLLEHNGSTYRGSHTPMVTEEEFDRVQELLSARKDPVKGRYQFIYGRLMQCGECGGSVTAERKKNRHGHEYIYYHCTKRIKDSNCTQKSIEEKEFERQFKFFIKSLISDPTQNSLIRQLTPEKRRFSYGGDFEKREIVERLCSHIVLLNKKIQFTLRKRQESLMQVS